MFFENDNFQTRKMKKIIYGTFIFTILIAGILACKKSFLESDPQTGVMFDENFFKDKKDFDAFIFGAYAEIQGAGSFFNLGIQQWIVDGGIMMQDIRQGNEQPYDLNNYVTPTSSVANAWQTCYKTIGRANLLLSKIQTSPGSLTDAEKKSLAGEAKFLRGFAFFSLAQRYGDAVVYLDPYDVADQASLSLARSPEVQVWDQVILDLKEAAATLPVSWDAANTGRSTKGAAIAYLANAYMYTKDWANAKQSSQDLIALGKYSLLPDMRNLFSYLYENTAESIFEIQYRFVPGAQIAWSGQPNYGNFLNWFTGPLGAGAPYAIFGGQGTYPTARKLADSFDPNDKRRKELIKVPGESYAGETMAGHTYNIPLNITQKNSAFNTKWWVGASNQAGIEEWFWYQNIIVMRYAEVLLNYSEILFESGDVAGAYANLNLVRARAGVPARAEQSNRDTYFTQLMQERRWELFWEPNLWFHYTRTGRAAKFLLDEYGLVMNSKFNKFPIPQGDIDLNPKLIQNTGY